MTETLKDILRKAKNFNEAYETLKANESEISVDDKMNIYKMVSKKDQLTVDELNMVICGKCFTETWNSFAAWCSDHKTAVIIAACILAGACALSGGMPGFVV